MDLTDVIFLSLLLLPHVSIVLAWIFRLQRAGRLALPRWRSIAVLVGLLAGSLNIAVFWAYVAWLHHHYTTESWKGRDLAFSICEPLIVVTIGGGLLGRGRTRMVLCSAGILGFFLWVTTSVGVL